MTSDDYRLLLTTKNCPNCKKQFDAENMGMYGDAYGWPIDDSSFRYTLYAYCRVCKTQSSFKDLDIQEGARSTSQHIH